MGTFPPFASSFAVTTGLVYCADSTRKHQRKGITSHVSLPLTCVLKSVQLDFSSDCNAGVPLPSGPLSVVVFNISRTVVVFLHIYVRGVTF